MEPQASLPTGKITIVFTDIEDSSKMTADLGNPDYARLLRDPHRAVMQRLFAEHRGVPNQTQGDSYMTIFHRANDALACVTAIQNQFAAEPLTAQGQMRPWTLRVRIGVHSTEHEVFPTRLDWMPDADMTPGHVEYSGTDTNFASRVGGMGVGGQIIVSDSTYRAADTKRQYQWKAWPNRRLKSFEAAPETVWELLYDGQSRGEPGARWVPDWYRGELNRYIARPELQELVIDQFKADEDGIRRRLVTLCAEGGMGKSRLAVACALEIVGLFQNGVYFVNLARDETSDAYRTREAIAQSIGLALGLSGEALQPSNLLASLASSERLLVFDNYESVDSKDVRGFIRDLLNQTISLCLLVTGRTAVKLSDAEQIVPMDDGMTPEQARDLFVTYAPSTKRGPQWTPDADDERDIQRILTLTERIPLAVELAAAWAGAKSIKEIADGLHATPLGRFTGVQKDTDRADPSPHHYSLTRSLDWSYSLLEPGAGDAFAALSLFAESFDKQAVAAVLDLDMDDAEDMLDYLHQVSLVRRSEVNKTSRYSLHRFTREYAKTKLDALPDADTIRQRFVAHYCQFVNDNDNLNDVTHRAVLTMEWQNAFAAVQTAGTIKDWPSVIMLSDLGRFLNLRGMWSEQESLYDAALDAARTSNNRRDEGAMLNNLGNVYYTRGQWDKAEQAYSQSLTIRRKLGDKQGEGGTLNNLGNVYKSRGQWDRAEQAYNQSLAICRELGDRQGEGKTLNNLGVVYRSRGQWDKAEQACQQSLIICRELGDKQGEGRTLGNLGLVYQSRGQWDRAEQAYQQDLAICRELGDRQGEGKTLMGLGNVYYSRGQWDKAEQAYQQSLIICRELGDKQGEGKTLMGLGNVHYSRGFWDKTEQAYNQSLAICRELGDRQGEGKTLNNLGVVYRSRGQWDKAEQACQQSLIICRELGDKQGEGQTLRNLALLMEAQGRNAEAIALAQDAVAVFEQTEDAAGLEKAQNTLNSLLSE